MKITINGRDHKVTTDSFGITYVDGLTIEQFLENASIEDVRFLAKYGLNLAQVEPDHAADIADRHEL